MDFCNKLIAEGFMTGQVQRDIPLVPSVAAATPPIELLLARRHGLLCVIPPILTKLARQGQDLLCPRDVSRINVGTASCGQAAGAGQRLDLLTTRADFAGAVKVHNVGCIGACYAEPLIDVRTTEGRHYLFGKAGSINHSAIIRTALKQRVHDSAWLVLQERHPGILTGFEDLDVLRAANNDFAAFFAGQQRRISGHCGLIDPHSLAEYVATGGYFALAKALFEQTPSDLIAEITASGLRGRGGSGFPTGQKWLLAAESSDPLRMVVANADEGDPGAYMNRTLLESDPHRCLEGLLLAAYAVGAQRAYVFVRHEYQLSIANLRKAIADLYAAGLLGSHILGTGFSLEVEIIQSGGAFVCGEETALLQVMQGRRGEPVPRPPYPAEQGLGGHPTVINNVETLANVPWILTRGAEEFRATGSAQSPGTKIFCLTGDLPRPGFIEVPLGTRTATVVEEIGGAAPQSIKALQIGGPSGGLLPYRDTPLDYSTLQQAGAMIGSGGLVVLNKSHCMVDLCKQLTAFMAAESCGQCLFCRDGLAQLHKLLDRLTRNRADESLLRDLAELSRTVSELSRCGLGRSAVNPLLSGLTYFAEEFASHTQGICPAGACHALIRFEIDQTACTDCLVCYKVCPVGAITLLPGRGPARYRFEDERCVRCHSCTELCPHACIMTKPRKTP